MNEAFPSWEERKREILQQNGNLRVGVLQYIRDLEELEEYVIVAAALRELLLEFNDDAEVLLAITPFSYLFFPFVADVSTRLRDNEDFMTKFVQKYPSGFCRHLEFASPRLLDDNEFMTGMVKRNSFHLRYSSPRLKNNAKFVMTAVLDEDNPENAVAVEYASINLRSNKQFMVEVVKINGGCLRYAHANLRDDEEVAIHALRNNGVAIIYTSPRLRDNKQHALVAVQEWWGALKYASPRLKADFDVALAARRKYGRAIRYVSDSLQHNIDIVTSSELQNLNLPQTNNILNQDQPLSMFPYLLERSNPMIIFYLLKNRADLIPCPTDVENKTSSNKKRKRIS